MRRRAWQIRLRPRPCGVGALVALLLGLVGPAANACEAKSSGWGAEGRSAEVEFLNRKGAAGRHEGWVSREARLILHAGYERATDEYDHDILGAAGDMKVLTLHVRQPGDRRITCPAEMVLPAGEVFEDIAPRLADLTGDGLPEVIVVQSSVRKGARLAVYDRRARLLAATPPIGRTHRWLAPVGAADLDGDGAMEIAYVDRPHLAKVLRIWRFKGQRLQPVADVPGLTNHRIGWNHIPGGIRDCGAGPEIITADGDWQSIVATRWDGRKATTRRLAAYAGPESLNRALQCR